MLVYCISYGSNQVGSEDKWNLPDIIFIRGEGSTLSL